MTAFLKDTAPFFGTGDKNDKGQTLEEFLEEYDPYKYKNPCVTTDAAVFSYENVSGGTTDAAGPDSRWKILMVQRGNHPCIGWWALPGGFVELGEDLAETARRELEEETGVRNLPMEQFAVYGNVDRDPRARVITSAYLSVVEASQVKVEAGDDAADACWYEICCKSEPAGTEEGQSKTIHNLTLWDRESGSTLTASVVETRRTGLVQERTFTVEHSRGIASDHAAIIVQGWILLETRLFSV